jgi:hypothetical protein
MYRYEDLKTRLLTDDGQRIFLKARDAAHALLAKAGAFSAERLFNAFSCPDSWLALACVDRLVELGEIRCIHQHPDTWAQHRVYVGSRLAP